MHAVSVLKELVSYIKSNKLKVGDKLPTESELAIKLNTSKLSLREALNVLKEDGLIYKKQGAGTFLASDFRKISETLDINFGITELIEISGYEPGSIHFSRSLVLADDEIAGHLNLSLGSNIILSERVRTADGIPVVYSKDYLNPKYLSGILSTSNENISIYDFIENVSGLSIGNALAKVIPVLCDDLLHEKLQCKTGSPMLLMKHVLYSEEGWPLLFGLEYFRTEFFDISVNRRRAQYYKSLKTKI